MRSVNRTSPWYSFRQTLILLIPKDLNKTCYKKRLITLIFHPNSCAVRNSLEHLYPRSKWATTYLWKRKKIKVLKNICNNLFGRKIWGYLKSWGEKGLRRQPWVHPLVFQSEKSFRSTPTTARLLFYIDTLLWLGAVQLLVIYRS